MRAICQKLLLNLNLLCPLSTKANRKIEAFQSVRSIMSESDQSHEFESPRLVTKKVQAKLRHEGDGALVRRGIGTSELKSLDPFLMLDDFSVAPPAGFPDHPHRGSLILFTSCNVQHIHVHFLMWILIFYRF
uniref:Pirin-like family protein n=1 Tax=Rhizophora mucronata TaxID=61149 RepID=A0A2P2KTB0_RHIMU